MKRVTTYKERKKLSVQILTESFPGYDPSGHAPIKATQKGYQHKVNATWKPKKAKLTPAQWHRMRRGKPAPYNHK